MPYKETIVKIITALDQCAHMFTTLANEMAVNELVPRPASVDEAEQLHRETTSEPTAIPKWEFCPTSWDWHQYAQYLADVKTGRIAPDGARPDRNPTPEPEPVAPADLESDPVDPVEPSTLFPTTRNLDGIDSLDFLVDPLELVILDHDTRTHIPLRRDQLAELHVRTGAILDALYPARTDTPQKGNPSPCTPKS